jgi:hypothetical protein
MTTAVNFRTDAAASRAPGRDAITNATTSGPPPPAQPHSAPRVEQRAWVCVVNPTGYSCARDAATQDR